MFLAKHSAKAEHHPRPTKALLSHKNCYMQQLFRIICALSTIKVAKLLLIVVLFMGRPYGSYTQVTSSNTSSAAYVGGDSDNNITTNVDQNDGIARNFDSTNGLPLTESGENNNKNNPSEVQKAVCTVTAGEVRASAEAVTTKTLKGVCGSAEMNLAIHNLEMKLMEELREVKHLITNFLSNTTNVKGDIQSFSTSDIKDTVNLEIIQNTTELVPNVIKTKTRNLGINNQNYRHDQTKYAGTKLKSLPRKLTIDEREQEVFKFNNSMLTDRDLKVFTYYWKIENFSEHISTIDSHTIESQIFSIKGKPLRIKASFQHLRRDFLYLQLECAPFNTTTNQNNIILDTGGLFKEIAGDKVSFKYKISILNQSIQRIQDLVSQEFYNLETGFLIPNSALLGSSYVKNNSLLIQIFMYL